MLEFEVLDHTREYLPGPTHECTYRVYNAILMCTTSAIL